eukprot:403341410
MISQYGRRPIIQLGVATMGLSFILFSTLSYVDNPTLYIIIVFAIRLLQGFASSSIQTTCYSICTNFYPDKKEALVGYIEAVTGIGLILGPIIGSVLYTMGGFTFTFFTFGSVFIVTTFYINKIFPKRIDNDTVNQIKEQFAQYKLISGERQDDREKNQSNKTSEIGYFTLLSNSRFLFGAISASLGYFLYGFMEPILAFRLNDYKLNQLQIGLFFTILPVFYIPCSILVQFMPRGIEKRAILIVACALSFFVNLCVGPSQILGFPDSIIMMGVGQALHGIVDPFILVPSLPEMINSVADKYPYNETQVNDLSSAIFNCFLGIGQISGPLFGSIMTEYFNFRLTSDYVAVICLAFALIYFVFGQGYSAFRDSEWTNYGEPIKFGSSMISTPLNRSRVYSSHSHDIYIRQRKHSGFSNIPQFTDMQNSVRYFQQQSFTQDKDFYKILEVRTNANSNEIKKAFFNLAKKYHPDILQSQKHKHVDYKKAQERFKEINEAYQILSNEVLRLKYDEFRGYVIENEEPMIDPSIREDSIYSQLLRRRIDKLKKQQEPQRKYNLDEELRKLEQIKAKRQQEQQERKNEAYRKRQDAINQMFFKKEWEKINIKSRESGDSKSYYKVQSINLDKDQPDEKQYEKIIVEQNKDQAAQMESDTTKVKEPKDGDERGGFLQHKTDYLSSHDNLEYFTSEFDNSARVEKMDRFMNFLYKIVYYGVFSLISVLAYLHFSQKFEAQKYASLVTQKKQRKGVEMFENEDKQVEIYVDNQLIEVVETSDNEPELPGMVGRLKSNQFMVANNNIYPLLKSAIRYLVNAQNNKETLQDFNFYNSKIKAAIKNEDIYDDVINKMKLNYEPYGVNYRHNSADMKEIQRDVDSKLSIFDNLIFIYYVCKYCETVGLEALLAVQDKISYPQKRRVVEYILQTECELGVQASSWKHCLLFLYMSGFYRVRNEDVELSHIEIKDANVNAQKNMIVMHGLLGNKLNWRGLCNRDEVLFQFKIFINENLQILAKRNCYLVELRNHMSSNHHDEMNYMVITDDIIRFADKLQLEKFTVLGHSLGGRTAMTLACRFPDRVDGCISVDSAPVDERTNLKFREFTYSVLEFMNSLSNKSLSKDQAIKEAQVFFKNKTQFVALLERNMDPNHKDEVKWLVNAEALFKEYDNIPYFDEQLRYQGPCYHLVGEKSRQYSYSAYQKVFPNITTEDIVVVNGAGHWVHFDKPLETIKHIAKFLDKIDSNNQS